MEVGAQTPAPLSDQVTPSFCDSWFYVRRRGSRKRRSDHRYRKRHHYQWTILRSQGTVNLSGQNFSANLTDFGSVSTFGNFGISPCSRSVGRLNAPCTEASLNFISTGSDPKGTFTINGTTFTSSVVDSLSLNLQSVNFVIPQNLLDASAVRIIAPFTFIGVAAPSNGPQVNLEGQGTVTLFLTRQTVFGFTACFSTTPVTISVQQSLGSRSKQCPEPAMLMLMFTGLAGVLQVTRSRRRNR